MNRGTEHVKVPIVAGAVGVIECTCGFACDTTATVARTAREEFLARHRHEDMKLTYRRVNYADHELTERKRPSPDPER